jgi:tetratricopeptide (TPR) repeat protein
MIKQFFSLLLVLCLSASPLFAQTIAEGKVQLENENFSSARKIFEDLIAKDVSNAEAYYYLAESYYLDEKPTEAKKYYEKGVAANSKSALNLIGLGKLLLDDNKTAEAKKNFDQAIKVSKSKDANIFYQVGSSYLNSKNANYNAAVENLTKARDLNTKNPEYFLTLGDAYLAKADGGNAMNNYDFAIDKDPNNPRGYMKKAKLAKGAKIIEGPEGAVATFEKAIAKDPNYAPAYKDLIELYYAQKQYNKVTDLLKKYTTLVGTDIEARMRYVRFLTFQAKDYDTAITEADKVLKDDASQYTMYRWLGWSYYEKGLLTTDEAAAKDLFKKAQDAMKTFFDKAPTADKLFKSDYEYYARAAEKAGDMTTAMAQYRKVLEQDSTQVYIYDLIAKSYFDNKDYANAAKAYEEKVAKTKPTSQDYYYIGRCYYSLKDYKKADNAFVKVVELNPTWPSGLTWRGRCNEQLDPDSKLGLALPFYQQMIPVAAADPSKYKKDLIEGYLYLGYYYYSKEDYSSAKYNYGKVIELDPSNKTANDALSALSSAEGQK